MLILGRKFMQKIIVKSADGPIIVMPVRMHGDHVQIGIDAPPNVRIVREELIERATIDGNLNELEERFDSEDNLRD